MAHHLTAVIYDKRNRILSIGQNSYIKTHPYQAKLANKMGVPCRLFLHAEIAAIIRCKDLQKAHRIFISRFTKDNKPAMAKPCSVCMEAIKQAGIKHIEYTV